MSFSRSGGAGQVAQSLVDYQSREGLEARFVAQTETNLRQDGIANLPTVVSAAVDNFVIKNPRHKGLLSLTRDSLKTTNLELVPSGDVLHLHWITGIGQESILNFASKHRVVFWTLHDMSPFTGACHQSFDCLGYKYACSTKCPAVRSSFSTLVKKNFEKKIRFLTQIKNLTLIAPTPWLKEAFCSTPGLENVPIEVIGNPIGIETEKISREYIAGLRNSANEKVGSKTIGFIANDLSDPNKSLWSLLGAFKDLSKLDANVTLKCVGSGYERFSDARIENVEFLGSLGKLDIGDFLKSIDLLVVPSRAETSPLVVLEASFFGKPVLMRNISAARDFRLMLNNVSTFDNDFELSAKIEHILYETKESSAEKTRSDVLENYGINEVGSKITSLYVRKLASV